MNEFNLSPGKSSRLKLLTFLCLTLLITITSMAAIPNSTNVSATSTKLSVQPALKRILVNESFTINVTVSNVTDLYGWEFKLYYNSTVLNGSLISEGPCLKSSGDTFFQVLNFTDAYNSTHGIVWATCSLLGPTSGVNGSGVLVTITFKCINFGKSLLSIEDSTLGDSYGESIPHTSEDGMVETWPRNIAIINLQVSRTNPYHGQTIEIYITVRNEGNYTESFNLTTYYDGSEIGTIYVAEHPPLSDRVYTILWNTLQAEANISYIIRAEASILPGEANITDNVFTYGTITIRPVAVNIAEVVSCNQTGYKLTSFQRNSMIYFRVNITNTNNEFMPVLVTVNIFDYEGTVIGVATFQSQIAPGCTVIILGFRIPSTAKLGKATVYANVFDDWPHRGGVPYCPEQSAQFTIEG